MIAERVRYDHGAMKANRETAERMSEAASAWLETLAPMQRRRANELGYFPREHKGLPLLEMDTEQQKLAHALVARSLSLSAYAKVTAIMALESVLNEIEGRRTDALLDSGRRQRPGSRGRALPHSAARLRDAERAARARVLPAGRSRLTAPRADVQFADGGPAAGVAVCACGSPRIAGRRDERRPAQAAL
jgi:hypothetical protein